MAAPAWLDVGTSVSWLRAFERLSCEQGLETHAVLREHHYDATMSAPIRGVHYTFVKPYDKLAGSITGLQPDVVFYNNCQYAKLPQLMRQVADGAPGVRQIVRTHHEVRRVLPPALLAQVLEHADHIIVSTRADTEALAEVPLRRPYSVIPFGVDVPYYAQTAEEAKTIDFIASCSSNPVKDLPLLRSAFAILASRGFTTLNVLGRAKAEYARLMRSARVYFSPTTSEASGSRSLLEAYACGVYPVVSRTCASTCELVGKLGGHIIDTAHGDAAAVADELEQVLKALPELPKADLKPFSEAAEVRQLAWLLSCGKASSDTR